MFEEDQDPNNTEYTQADADFITVLYLVIVFGIIIVVATL